MAKNDNGITDELIGDILNNVKIPLNIDDTKLDKLLTLYITMICNNILIRTNRKTFPEPLKYVAIDLVKDKFDSNNKEDPALKAIQSMTETDRSVTFGTQDVLKNKLNLIAQKQLDENEKLINRYKLLYRT